jgi:hypothetical protein
VVGVQLIGQASLDIKSYLRPPECQKIFDEPPDKGAFMQMAVYDVRLFLKINGRRFKKKEEVDIELMPGRPRLELFIPWDMDDPADIDASRSLPL